MNTHIDHTTSNPGMRLRSTRSSRRLWATLVLAASPMAVLAGPDLVDNPSWILPVADADPWPGGPGPGGGDGGGLPGGGTQFVPPNAPQLPEYSASNSLPPLNQANSVNIYNQAAQPLPAQAAQNAPAEQPGPPMHGQQPSTYDHPKEVQQMSKLMDHCDELYAVYSADCRGQRSVLCWEQAAQAYADCLKR